MFPQVIIEVIIIFLVCLLILIQSYTSDLNEQFFYSAAIFLMGAYRIKPFFVSLLEYATTVKLNENQVNGIYYLFEENKELIATQLHGIKNFEIENIHFRNINFSTKNREIFQNIDFQIEKGDKIFIYGESGSGKSTLLNLLLKFKKPKSGEILINGRNIDDYNYENFLHKINYLQQEPEIFEGTLLENISLRDSDKADLNKLNEVIELCNLTNFFKYNCKNNFNFNLKELGNNLSGGERQRITLARVIYEGRKLIILDEPVKSLDESNQIEITKNLIKKLKSSTLIFLSHNPILEKYFDKVYYIKNRKLIKKL